MRDSIRVKLAATLVLTALAAPALAADTIKIGIAGAHAA